MTAPDEAHPRPWARRTVLRALAPLPLLAAAGGCGGSDGRSASSAASASAAAGASSGPSQTPGAPTSSASAALPGASPVALTQPEVSQAPSVTDAVALTFHGDGTAELAEALLAEAEKADARLTVLAVGRWLANYPQMAERVLKGGHELGNHTENHLDIDAMSASQAYDEIERCAQRLEQLTGSRGRWFRQSQAQHANAVVLAAAKRAGYGTLLSYDLDPLDYTDPGSTRIVNNVLGKVRGGDVVSLHLGHPETVTALPVILTGLRQRGLRAVTASELFPVAGTSPSSQTTQSS
ncbi:polysaccharide deacetylase family protein [Actinospica sp. MGRD01-02]|uniref:Polysaccharide deacetylase family protein n=1 Tax=Actinospica acidithermotolerans TaxID=2828514 RepID=A0A941IJC0_9ACTN|nr:polysaccharide deacetylase family protein [Actinospica acidithermotolerans]MBR7830580.1 polysaccharide deacetylase family protein [Actinospica acidithermotolerans]